MNTKQARAINKIEMLGSANMVCLDLIDMGLRELPARLFEMDDQRTRNGFTGFKSLDLTNNNLRTLPPEMGSLQDLEEICLKDNELVDLPPELARCTKLKYINLNGNNQLNPQLKAIYKASKNPPRQIVEHCRDGKMADQILEYLRSMGGASGFENYQYSSEGTNGGRMDATLVPAGRQLGRAPVNLFDHDWGSERRESQRNARVVIDSANPTNYKPHASWGREEFVHKGGKNCNSKYGKQQINVNGSPSSGESFYGGKKCAPDRDIPRHVVGTQMEGTPHSQAGLVGNKPGRRVIEERGNIKSFGVVDIDPQYRRVRKGEGKYLEAGYKVNKPWAEGTDGVNSDCYKIKKRVGGYDQRVGINFESGADDPNAPRIRNRAPVAGAPQNQFSLAPDAAADGDYRNKRAAAQARLSTTSAHEIVHAHGATSRDELNNRKPPGRYDTMGSQRALPSYRKGPDINTVKFKRKDELSDFGPVDSLEHKLQDNDEFAQFEALDLLRGKVCAGSVPRAFFDRVVNSVNKLILSMNAAVSKNALLCIRDCYTYNGQFMIKFTSTFLPTVLIRCAGNEQLSGAAIEAVQAICKLASQPQAPRLLLIPLYNTIKSYLNACSQSDSGWQDNKEKESNSRMLGWCCYAVREIIIHMNDNGEFLKNNNANLDDLLNHIVQIRRNDLAEVSSIAQNTLEMLARKMGTTVDKLTRY